MKLENYDITEIFWQLFFRDLEEGKTFSYSAQRQMDGGQIFNSDGKLVGRIEWSEDGRSVTISRD